MGWIAGAVCSLVIGFAVYKFLGRDGEHHDTKEETTHPQASSQIDKRTAKAVTPNVKSREPVLQAKEQTAQDHKRDQPRLAINSGAKLPQKDITSDLKKLNPSITSMPPPPPPPPKVTPAPSINMAPPRSKSPPRLKPPTFSAAPPRPGGGSLQPPPSAASSLRVPVTKVLPNTSMAPSALMAPPQQKKSKQIILEPGHSPLDWAALTSNPTNNLRGKDAPTSLARITPAQLKAQNGRKGRDAWTVYQGKVYNITPYVPFHPGGKGEILRGAAKDSAKLFNEVHPWVNWDGMLKECMVGILVSDEEIRQENTLDEMD